MGTYIISKIKFTNIQTYNHFEQNKHDIQHIHTKNMHIIVDH